MEKFKDGIDSESNFWNKYRKKLKEIKLKEGQVCSVFGEFHMYIWDSVVPKDYEYEYNNYNCPCGKKVVKRFKIEHCGCDCHDED